MSVPVVFAGDGIQCANKYTFLPPRTSGEIKQANDEWKRNREKISSRHTHITGQQAPFVFNKCNDFVQIHCERNENIFIFQFEKLRMPVDGGNCAHRTKRKTKCILSDFQGRWSRAGETCFIRKKNCTEARRMHMQQRQRRRRQNRHQLFWHRYRRANSKDLTHARVQRKAEAKAKVEWNREPREKRRKTELAAITMVCSHLYVWHFNI